MCLREHLPAPESWQGPRVHGGPVSSLIWPAFLLPISEKQVLLYINSERPPCLSPSTPAFPGTKRNECARPLLRLGKTLSQRGASTFLGLTSNLEPQRHSPHHDPPVMCPLHSGRSSIFLCPPAVFCFVMSQAESSSGTGFCVLSPDCVCSSQTEGTRT